MSREIKFRAWDNENRKFIDKEIFIGCGGRIGFWNNNNTAELIPLDNIILMQFTGLLDKNKNKIFEGDILQHGQTIIKVPPIIPISRLHIFYQSQTENDWFSWSDVDWEIIGNIYESKHLLNQ